MPGEQALKNENVVIVRTEECAKATAVRPQREEAYRQQLAREAAARAAAEREVALKQEQERTKQAAAAKALKDADDERKAKFNTFARSAGVTSGAGPDKLNTNPFPFEGKVIATMVRFETMLSRDVALFSDGSQFVAVSKVPVDQFTRQGWFFIAGRVMGKTEVKLPLIGATQVPQLQFTSALECQEPRCKDLLPPTR